MPKTSQNTLPLQRKIIDKMIFAVAAIQPLGTIPQIITIYTQRNATSISLTSWAIYIVFDILWLWYGLADKQKAVIVSAVMFALLESAVFLGGLLYGATL